MDGHGFPAGLPHFVPSPPTCVTGTMRAVILCSGSDRGKTLQDEVSKMLQKGAVEPMDQPGPGFYNQQSLVEKVTGAGGPS